MQVKELLENLGIPESEVTIEKRAHGTEIRYKKFMLDLSDDSIEIYAINSEGLEKNIGTIYLGVSNSIPRLKRILQLN